MRILIRGDTASTDTGLKEGGKGEGRGGVSDINTETMHADLSSRTEWIIELRSLLVE